MSHARSESSLNLSIASDRSLVSEVAGRVMSLVESHGFDRASRFAVRLALEEALTNAIRHGHRGLEQQTPVQLDVRVSDQRVKIVVEDQGPGFSPEGVPDPTLDENLSKPFGRGLMLIRAYMTRVDHNERGNRIEMLYERPASD